MRAVLGVNVTSTARVMTAVRGTKVASEVLSPAQTGLRPHGLSQGLSQGLSGGQGVGSNPWYNGWHKDSGRVFLTPALLRSMGRGWF